MGSNFNFNNFGTDPSAAAGGGENTPAFNFPLMRQNSIYSLTFDEFQSTVGGIGKDFGSMNMDELLKSIWSAEENQNIGSSSAAGAAVDGGGQEGSGYLQRQGSLTLPRTLSLKTVDEVWRDMSKEYGAANEASGSGGGGGGGFSMPHRQPTLGEVTLEEFLVRAGVVREEAQVATKPNNVGIFGDFSPAEKNSGLEYGFQATNGMVGLTGGTIAENINQIVIASESANVPMNVNGGPKKPTSGNGVLMGIPSTNHAPNPWIRNGIIPIPNPSTNNSMAQIVTLQNGGLGMVGLGSPASDGFSKSNGDTSSVSPVPYAFNGGSRGRRTAPLEKVVERRQRRMIKNRESAARSRARKQAYTTELEAEIAKLKEENEELRKRQAEMIEMHKNQEMEMMNQQRGTKRRRLRRTQTGPL